MRRLTCLLVVLILSFVIGLSLCFSATPAGVIARDDVKVTNVKTSTASPIQKVYSVSRVSKLTVEQRNGDTLTAQQFPNPIKISLDSETDWAQILLTLLAIATVIGTTCFSIHTINKKTEEAIKAHDDSVKSQTTIAELNIRTQVLSANRQAWINTLRDEIAHYLSDLHTLQFEKSLGHEMDQKNCSLALKNAYSRRNKIQLLINPKEEDHQQLVSMVYEALPCTSKTFEELNEVEARVIAIAQEILKREWIRVKAVE